MRFPKLRRKLIRKTPIDQRAALFTKHFVAGGIAGVISRTVTAPMDRLKIFYQVSTTHRTMTSVFKEMIKEGGVRSLWRGNLINVIKTMPKSAIRFALYDKIKTRMKARKPDVDGKKVDLHIGERFYAGAIAGVISQALTFPMEVLKVRLSLRKTGEFNGMFDACVKIYKAEGLRAFAKGFWPCMVAIIPYSGFDLALYETIKNIGIAYRERRLNNRELFLVSCLACIISQTLCYPLSIVCTRMQASTASAKDTKSAYQVTMDVWKYEGIAGFYRGLVPNLLKFIPVISITFVTYEQIIQWMNTSMS